MDNQGSLCIRRTFPILKTEPKTKLECWETERMMGQRKMLKKLIKYSKRKFASLTRKGTNKKKTEDKSWKKKINKSLMLRQFPRRQKRKRWVIEENVKKEKKKKKERKKRKSNSGSLVLICGTLERTMKTENIKKKEGKKLTRTEECKSA